MIGQFETHLFLVFEDEKSPNLIYKSISKLIKWSYKKIEEDLQQASS